MTKSLPTHALNNQSSGVRSMREPGLLQRGRGLLGVGFGDDEVDVVHGFGAAEHPQRVAARQREIRALRPQRRRGAPQRVAQVVVACGTVS